MRGKTLLMIFIVSLSLLVRFSNQHLAEVKSQAIGISLEWSFETELGVSTTPNIIDIDNDGQLEIIFGSDEGILYCLDINGNKLWNFTTDRCLYSSPTIADLDNNGFFEIVIGSYDEYVYCINHDAFSIQKKSI